MKFPYEWARAFGAIRYADSRDDPVPPLVLTSQPLPGVLGSEDGRQAIREQ
jgi:hypothetical protein